MAQIVSIIGITHNPFMPRLFKQPQQQKGVRRKNESGRLAACRIYILPLRLLAARHYVAFRPHAVGHLQSESHITLSEPTPRSYPDSARELRFDNRAQFPSFPKGGRCDRVVSRAGCRSRWTDIHL